MEQISINKLLSKYLKHWPLFAIGIVTCLAAVFLYLRYWAETQYEIKSTILVKANNEGQGSIKAESIKNLGLIKNSYNVEDEIGILTSSGIMEKVISAKALNINFYIEGRVRDVEIFGENSPVNILVDETASELIYNLPIRIKLLENNKYELEANLQSGIYKAEHTFGDLVSAPFGTFTITANEETKYEDNGKPLYFVIRETDSVIREFLGNLNVELANMDGNLLSIRFLSNNKSKGEEVVAGLIETYVEEMIKYENELAENTIKMIDNRLKLLSGEIEGVEKTVEEFRTKNDPSNVANNTEIYIAQANDYKKLISDYQTEINVINAIETYLQQGNSETPIPASLSANDPSLTSMIDQYNATLLQKGQMSQSASSANPVIVNLDRTLNDLSKAIVENVRSAKNRLMISQRNLQSNANKYQAQIAKVPSMERQLVDISRDKSTKEGLYLYLLQKREEEVLSLAAPVSSTRIVSLPKAGAFPVSPNKKLFYLAGLLVGFFAPIVFVNAKEILNNKIINVEDITETISVPFLGEIATNKNNANLVTEDKDQSQTLELFRLLHFNLDYLKKTENNQTLLVTSTIQGEGKTFIASNLAATLAVDGEKVVVLAFDLRQPQLMKNFGLPNTPGLVDYIVKNDISIDKIIQKHPTIENLHLIGSGMEINQVGRLLLSKRIGPLMDTLKSNFDRIIIDTPPIGLISDAFALNRYVDSSIYVVRKDVTKKQALQTIRGIHKDDKLNNTMVLLNDTVPPESYGYNVPT
ncbi:AAA family ATPase [Zobellia galactanivorans]|uniref:GumC family protein n=1 Tax=Zobellia galactanivorans (strain DSM 12802 / CCUG 47099 / CIP 106680 / NCIMB 13871 / Dsij) TaxID=63186 RepID=UPI0026E2AD4D|nr:polysaccharide biosynthesis tyrosine autokinase [Zobellia galactanivorans]MDO6810423.1 AAA family ATPase [Zobellia galactanivorans]